MSDAAPVSVRVEQRGLDVRVSASVELERSTEEMFHFLRNPINLSRFLGKLQAVEKIGPGRSRWIVPLEGGAVSWVVAQASSVADGAVGWWAVDADAGTMFAQVRCAPGARPDRSRLVWTVSLRSDSAAHALLGEDARGTLQHDLERLVQLMRPAE